MIEASQATLNRPIHETPTPPFEETVALVFAFLLSAFSLSYLSAHIPNL